MHDTNQSLEAVDKLTKTWEHLFGPRELGPNNYKRVEYPPMLDSLKEAIHFSSGKNGGGGTDNRANPFDLRAFEMWENIDGIVRAWGKDLGTVYDADLKVVLRRVYVRVNALPADDTRHARLLYMVKGWVESITEMFDPPTVKELVGDCPMSGCGQRYVKNESGDITSALIAYYRTDSEPEAKCRSCGATWVGVMALRTLGFGIKARVDDDALREMGISV